MLEHQAAFTEMLRVGRDMRKRMFDTLEERHAQDFENGKAGRKLYEDLLSAVRDAGVPEAVTEFESRFLPLLNRDRPQGDAESGFSGGVTDRDRMIAAEDRRGGGWVWIWSLAVAAVITGALFFGYSFLKVTASKPPAVTETARSCGKPDQSRYRNRRLRPGLPSLPSSRQNQHPKPPPSRRRQHRCSRNLPPTVEGKLPAIVVLKAEFNLSRYFCKTNPEFP